VFCVSEAARVVDAPAPTLDAGFGAAHPETAVKLKTTMDIHFAKVHASTFVTS
jgi:hypothetical protein